MKFAPVPAAGIFSVAVMAPAIPFVAMFDRRSPLIGGLVMVLICAILFCLFWAGARLSKRPHTVMSLVLAILVTWSFVFATNSLSKQFFATVAYAGWITELLQFAFVFLTAWQPTKKASATDATGNDSSAVSLEEPER